MTDQREWYVYILEVTARMGRVTVHVGIALDVQRRLSQHRGGKVKATAGKAMHKLLGHSGAMDQGNALALEAQLKRKSPTEKRDLAAVWVRQADAEHFTAIRRMT